MLACIVALVMEEGEGDLEGVAADLLDECTLRPAPAHMLDIFGKSNVTRECRTDASDVWAMQKCMDSVLETRRKKNATQVEVDGGFEPTTMAILET